MERLFCRTLRGHHGRQEQHQDQCPLVWRWRKAADSLMEDQEAENGEEYMVGGLVETGYQTQSEDSAEVRISGWLFRFSDLSALTPNI